MSRSQRQKVWNHGTLYLAPDGSSWGIGDPGLPVDPLAPVLTSLSPAEYVVGYLFTASVYLSGTGFTETSSGLVNGVHHDMVGVFGETYFGIYLTPEELATKGTLQIAAVQDGHISNHLPFRVVDDPKITSLEPANTQQFSPDTTVTIRGPGFFTPECTVKFNATPIVSSFVDESTMTCVIPAALLTEVSATGDQIVVHNGATVSEFRKFGVLTGTEVAPTLTSYTPAPVPNTYPVANKIDIYGTDITYGCEFYWNGVKGRKHAALPPDRMQAWPPDETYWTADATYEVTAHNYAANLWSEPLTVVIGTGVPVVLTSITPLGTASGSVASAIGITMNGAGFDASFVGRVNDVTFPMKTFTSDVKFMFQVTDNTFWRSGLAEHQVRAVKSDGSVSAAQKWRIVDNPILSSVEPLSCLVNSDDTTITVRGDRFTPDTQIRFKSTLPANTIPTTFIDKNTLTAVIPAHLLTTADATTQVWAATLNVLNTGMCYFGVLTGTETAPVMTSIVPSSIPAGSTAYISCEVHGTGFDEACRLFIDGVEMGSGVWYPGVQAFCWLHLQPQHYAVAKNAVVTMTHPVLGDSVAPLYLDMFEPDPALVYLSALSPTSRDVPTTADVTFECRGVGYDMTCVMNFRGKIYPATEIVYNGDGMKTIVPMADMGDPPETVPVTVTKGSHTTPPMNIKLT